ncbi:MAG TPA: NAD(P)-binding domain-containing protein [Pseudonocardiaceae bacterium]|nr:NAD(P)-binding domain-containing protein [Pseudonocardiaceae bacterium]
MTRPVEVAIVGAGPYGLSLGAHLYAAGIGFRQFGLPMQSWREAMPRGMFLTSPAAAANLSDPDGWHPLTAFCATTGRHIDPRLPVPRETFVAYGQWFARRHIPALEELVVISVTRPGGHYELTLCDGSRAQANRVVVATGMRQFAYTPSLLATLPTRVRTHSSAHFDLGVFRDTSIVVVGAGQSALESAALLHEAGARVQVLARTPELIWQPEPVAGPDGNDQPQPAGTGWVDRFYSTRPSLFRRLPAGRRVQLARTAWGPSGAHWLRSRVEGNVPTLVGHAVRWTEPEPWGVRLGLQGDGTAIREITVEHVLAATGYRTELSRLTFLDRRLRSAVRTLAGTPDVGSDFQSSIPGLYFVEPVVAATFGLVMRSLHGAGYAARTLTRWLTAERDRHGSHSRHSRRGRRRIGRSRLAGLAGVGVPQPGA